MNSFDIKTSKILLEAENLKSFIENEDLPTFFKVKKAKDLIEKLKDLNSQMENLNNLFWHLANNVK